MTVMNHSFLSAHHEKNDKTTKLTYDRCQCRSANPHGKAEDEERVQQTIDDGATDHSIYRILGKSLESHLIIDTESSHYKRCTQQTDTKILTCIWQNGGCTAQKNTDRFKEKQTCQHCHN